MQRTPYFPTTRDLEDSVFRQILDGLLNLVYPENCLICSAAITRQRDCGICAHCWNKAVTLRIDPPWCASCGLPFHHLLEDSESLCANCILNPPPFSSARSFGYYTGELSSVIQVMKFLGRRSLAEQVSSLLAAAFYRTWSREEFDYVVAVPLHPRRKRERGYNQSELLAQHLARRIALPLYHGLKRIRSTNPQVGLSNSERIDNVQGAFRCPDSRQVSGKRVLMVDDVMTTGATVASAAQALLEAGAVRVCVLTVARAVR